MEKKFLVLTVAVFAVSAHAQNRAQYEVEEWKSSQNEITNFDIGKYTTPNIVRNQLEMILNFRSDNTRDDESYPERDSRKETSEISGNLTSSFYHYVNTRKTISNLMGVLSLSGNKNAQNNKQTFVNSSPTTIDNESKLSQRNSLQLFWTNQWYFSKLFFIDYGLTNTSIQYLYNQDKTKKQSEEVSQENKYLGFNISPQAGVGYGRIENVRDARQAVYITQALSKKNVLTRQLSNDELFELSQKISTVKNKRFLDSRLRLIEEITTVDSFFVNNNLLTDNGAPYFTTLYDMWQYGDLFPRQSGYNISIVARPHFSTLSTKGDF